MVLLVRYFLPSFQDSKFFFKVIFLTYVVPKFNAGLKYAFYILFFLIYFYPHLMICWKHFFYGLARINLLLIVGEVVESQTDPNFLGIRKAVSSIFCMTIHLYTTRSSIWFEIYQFHKNTLIHEKIAPTVQKIWHNYQFLKFVGHAFRKVLCQWEHKKIVC